MYDYYELAKTTIIFSSYNIIFLCVIFTFKGSRMNVCCIIFILAMASIVAAQTTVCPADWFPAVFTATSGQVADKPVPFNDDPEFYFFKKVVKFRDEAIQHTTEDAIQLFFGSTTPLHEREQLLMHRMRGSSKMQE